MQSNLFKHFLQKLLDKKEKEEHSIEPIDELLLKQEYVRKENEIPAKVDYQKIRFLIADDFAEFLEVHKNLLMKSEALEVSTAVNGKELLDKFEKSEVGYYNVIITDYHMPIMNGYEAAKKVRMLDREDSHKVTMILVSCSDEINKNSYFSKDFDDVLSKPLKYEELTDSLSKYLRKNIGESISLR